MVSLPLGSRKHQQPDDALVDHLATNHLFGESLHPFELGLDDAALQMTDMGGGFFNVR
jgi:hypothetical protein